MERFTERSEAIYSGDESGTPQELLPLLGGYRVLMDECESPIEKMLGAALLFASDGYNSLDLIPFHRRFSLERLRSFRPDFGTIFYPQASLADFRVDFLIVPCVKGRADLIVVECDGHDYHDRTKEQAARDKSRDRALANVGAQVIRCTGSEIHRDISKCIADIEGVLYRKLEGLITQAGFSTRWKGLDV